MAAISEGNTRVLIDESPTTAGSKNKNFNIETDAVLVSLWVDSTAGDLDVTVYTLDENGKELPVIVFPTQTAPTSNIVLRRSGVVLSNMRVEATYTGAVNYRITVRAIGSGSGDTSIKTAGAETATASQATIATTAALLIPASLTDRSGLVIKNNGSELMYVGFSAAEANSSTGYPLASGEALGMDVSAGVQVWAVAASTSVDVRILEAGG